MTMKHFLKIVTILFSMTFGYSAFAQNSSYDVFNPITKYLSNGDCESLYAWFADNLEITILNSTSNSSRNQAKQILKSFFNTYSPREFQIMHKAGRANLKYALGSLNAGGEIFMVTIFVTTKDDECRIQQLKIERLQ